ncbi:MAG: hypothetical protein LRZ85_07125 [Alphaproteobacteria bacterium]|nr:hypothetical protein [Alphaproteobacteria bacterium]
MGEAQSALILIEHILKARPDMHILLTTGTRTSAESIGQKTAAPGISSIYPA